MIPMTNKRSTGDAPRFLGVTEPKLNVLIRRAKIRPEPEVLAGRRLWSRDHILQAAAALGVLTDELRARLEEEGADGQ